MKVRQLREGDVLDDGGITLVRGGELEPDRLAPTPCAITASKAATGSRYSPPRGATVDERTQQVPLVRFDRLTLIKVAAIRGLRLEPTGRNPRHYTVAFDDLDRGIAALTACEH